MQKLKRQLRSLSGNDFKVLFVIWLLGGFNVGNKKIKDWSKLSLPTIADSLNTLKIEGLIAHTQRTNGWQLSSNGFSLLMTGVESSQEFFDSNNSSSSLINIEYESINVKDTTTIEPSEKVFDSTPEVKEFLLSKGVWEKRIDEMAEIVDNDLELLEKHFDGVDTPLALWRLKSGIEPTKQKGLWDELICKECFQYPCDCESEEDHV